MVKKLSTLLSFLIVVFAIGSWIDLNGLWVELPLLVTRLPEGWKLPTYIVITIQLANISPLIYMIVHHYCKYRNMERSSIYFILSMGSICCGLLALFWDHTINVYLSGQWTKFSLIFFVLVWILSVVDTTSSVTFLPYLANYPRQFITALYVGEGLSGFLPAIAGFIQGVGGDPYCVNKTTVINGTNKTEATLFYPPPLYSPSGFFVLLAVILIICLTSFSVVDNCKCFHKYQIRKQSIVEFDDIDGEIKETIVPDVICTPEPAVLPEEKIASKRSRIKLIIYVILVAYINFFMNGVLPSIQNYTLMPYSSRLYHLVVTISQIVNPLSCLLTLYKWKVTIGSIIIMTVLESIGTGYLIFLASRSPIPVLNETVFGQSLAAFCWFIVSFIYSFEKSLLAIELQKEGHFWLQMCGVSTQVGSALGALIIFILIAVINVFKSKQILC